jgi:peptidoglycan/xylan/chitin deacetylase (PgdA/CDA1 family)
MLCSRYRAKSSDLSVSGGADERSITSIHLRLRLCTLAAVVLFVVSLPHTACAQALPENIDEGASSADQQPATQIDKKRENGDVVESARGAPAGTPPESATEARSHPAGSNPATERHECRALNVLNTFRTMTLGSRGGLEVGLKTYPRTLKLDEHEVVLTFDDGPLPGTTNMVLDALRDECVRATFFLVGRNAQAYPELVRREVREGHTIGHHSWSHPAITLRGLSEEAGRREIGRGIEADEHAAGLPVIGDDQGPRIRFFRFPGFADTPALLQWLASRNIVVFGADLWASDWLMMTPNAELNLVLSRLDAIGRGIILFHDTRVSTARMLPKFLRELKTRRYKIVHVEPGPDPPELVDAPSTWTSETEAIIGRVMPKLLSKSKSVSSRSGARIRTDPKNCEQCVE